MRLHTDYVLVGNFSLTCLFYKRLCLLIPRSLLFSHSQDLCFHILIDLTVTAQPIDFLDVLCAQECGVEPRGPGENLLRVATRELLPMSWRHLGGSKSVGVGRGFGLTVCFAALCRSTRRERRMGLG